MSRRSRDSAARERLSAYRFRPPHHFVYPGGRLNGPSGLCHLEGVPLSSRVFVDKSVIEVYANGTRCLALRVYPGRDDSVCVSVSVLRAATWSCVTLTRQLKSIWAQG
jgi:sucrose-6-phosphate hydrolase SacC (GH32 family)